MPSEICRDTTEQIQRQTLLKKNYKLSSQRRLASHAERVEAERRHEQEVRSSTDRTTIQAEHAEQEEEIEFEHKVER